MGFTQIYQFPREVYPSDPPGHTLYGGQSGTSPVLADAVEEELDRVETTVIGGIDSRVAALEAVPTPPSWVAIQSGTVSNAATFVISGIPTGVYSRLRLHMFGNNETTVDPIRIRVNGDSTTDLHKSGYLTHDAEGTLQFSTDLFDAEFWEIATWGTANGCTAEVTLFGTHTFNPVGFLGSGSRPASTLAGHQFTRSWGRLNSPRLVDSLRVSGPQGNNFSTEWWLEGSPA